MPATKRDASALNSTPKRRPQSSRKPLPILNYVRGPIPDRVRERWAWTNRFRPPRWSDEELEEETRLSFWSGVRYALVGVGVLCLIWFLGPAPWIALVEQIFR